MPDSCHALCYAIAANGACLHLLVPPLHSTASMVPLIYTTYAAVLFFLKGIPPLEIPLLHYLGSKLKADHGWDCQLQGSPSSFS